MGRASRDAACSASIKLYEILEGGPRSKISKVAYKAESIEQIQKFEATGSRANVTRSCDLRLNLVAPGIGRWGNFCETSGRQHFPPAEEVVLAWSAYCAAGGTFQMYLPQLEIACFLSGHDLSLKTRAVTQAAQGLARAGDRIREPKPAAPKALFVKIASRRGSTDPFAQAV